MKKVFRPPKLFALIAFVFCYTAAKGQEIGKDSTSYRKYEWEVATNLMPFLFSNNKSPYASFVRKNFTKLKNKKLIRRAYRMGIDFDSKIQNATLNYPNTTFSALVDDFGNFTSISLRLGYEWQFHLQRFHFYYGYEVYGTYRRLFFDVTNSLTNVQGVVYSENNQFRLGLRGLAGVKYFIHPRFAISAETGLFVEHIIEDSLWKQRNIANNGLESFSYQRSMNIIQSAPLFTINLSVLF